jgi:hypothetical protein
MRVSCCVLVVKVLLAAWAPWAAAQAAAPAAPAASAPDVDRLRTESGVDPTRVQSRASVSVLLQDLDGDAGQASMRAGLVLGVNRWSLSLKGDVVAQHTGQPGTGFRSGAGDVRVSALNAVYVKGRQAVAVAGEVVVPTAAPGLGAGYTSLTPSITYSYTIAPSLIFATQPQYTFHLFKDAAAPDLQVLTVRSFLAKFTSAGYFLVFEPRPVFDLVNDTSDLILSPIVGKSLGGGFNILFLAEFPVTDNWRRTRGNLYQFGFQKNF